MAKRKSVTHTMKRKVEYFPPASEDISRYAYTVCEELGEKVDPTFNTPEMRHELADFIKVVASIWSKHLNKQNQTLDKDS